MKNFVLRHVAMLSMVLLLTVAPASAEEVSDELKKVRESVSGLFAEIKPEEVFASPIDGWYTIRKGAIVAYISADGRYLLQGDLIDLEHQTNLSEKSRDEARVEMMAAVPDDQMIVFSPKDKKHSVTVFTDIDCTFCRRLHSQMDDYLAQGIEVRYMLYPRSGPATASWAKAEQVWCSSDRNEALTLAKLEEDFDTSSCDESVVSKHYSIGQDIGLRGTPAIVLQDGTLLSGYLPPEQLKQAIASTSIGGR